MTTCAAARRIEVYNAVAGAAFFRRLAREWQQAGADVTLVEGVSEHDYRAAEGRLGRARLRWRMWGGFAWESWRAARRGRAQLRVVTTNPFFAPALVARAAGPRVATIQVLYDLYPDALAVAGKLSPQSPLARCLAAVTRYALRHCAATVFLGERLRAAAESRYGQARLGVVIPVGADGEPFRGCDPLPLNSGERPRILYSGLMGNMHDDSTVARTWATGQGGGCAWVFHAGGAAYARLARASVRPADAVFGAPLGEEAWRTEMRRAHIALVTMAPGAEHVVMPSKTYSALVAGQAVLAVCPRDSDLADLVHTHRCGWIVETGDSEGLGRLVSRLASYPSEIDEKRRNAFAAGHRYFDISATLPAWSELFAAVTEAG